MSLGKSYHEGSSKNESDVGRKGLGERGQDIIHNRGIARARSLTTPQFIRPSVVERHYFFGGADGNGPFVNNRRTSHICVSDSARMGCGGATSFTPRSGVRGG